MKLRKRVGRLETAYLRCDGLRLTEHHHPTFTRRAFSSASVGAAGRGIPRRLGLSSPPSPLACKIKFHHRPLYDCQRQTLALLVIIELCACGKHAGRCGWSASFLGDLPFPPPFHHTAAPYSPRFTFIGSQDLVCGHQTASHLLSAGTLLTCRNCEPDPWPGQSSQATCKGGEGRGATGRQIRAADAGRVGRSLTPDATRRGPGQADAAGGLSGAYLRRGYRKRGISCRGTKCSRHLSVPISYTPPRLASDTHVIGLPTRGERLRFATLEAGAAGFYVTWQITNPVVIRGIKTKRNLAAPCGRKVVWWCKVIFGNINASLWRDPINIEVGFVLSVGQTLHTGGDVEGVVCAVMVLCGERRHSSEQETGIRDFEPGEQDSGLRHTGNAPFLDSRQHALTSLPPVHKMFADDDGTRMMKRCDNGLAHSVYARRHDTKDGKRDLRGVVESVCVECILARNLCEVDELQNNGRRLQILMSIQLLLQIQANLIKGTKQEGKMTTKRILMKMNMKAVDYDGDYLDTLTHPCNTFAATNGMKKAEDAEIIGYLFP
ncbi:hypothetical protein PR048_018365 [Dryococelus australis]|uniref:Uncharacterized protein n=1 Tax=Dryococelus australis TaxID=614101 RepID=A0ABQ9HC83_9NEOP|nr:hypothetical protein PR048_018365 [Dryococelus australis]